MSNKLKLFLFFGAIILIVTTVVLHILHLDESTFVEGAELLMGIFFVIGYILYEVFKKKEKNKETND